MKQSQLWLSLWLLLFSSPLWALHCGNYLVDVGMYKQDVLSRCGEPQSIDTHIEKRAVSNAAGLSQYYGNRAIPYPNSAINLGQQQYFEVDVVVEEWFYNFGRSRFQQLLRFENGLLIDIKELGYGR
jgi:hypothetical protein